VDWLWLCFPFILSSSPNNFCELSTDTNREFASRRMWIGFGCASLPSTLLPYQTTYVNSPTDELQVGERESGLRFPFIFSLCSSPITYGNSHTRELRVGERGLASVVLPSLIPFDYLSSFQNNLCELSIHTHTRNKRTSCSNLDVAWLWLCILPALSLRLSLLLQTTYVNSHSGAVSRRTWTGFGCASFLSPFHHISLLLLQTTYVISKHTRTHTEEL
jgi:hypothetical protein